MRFLTEDESERAMDLFEGASESHKISKSCLKNWVVRVYLKLIILSISKPFIYFYGQCIFLFQNIFISKDAYFKIFTNINKTY